jgi:hypothetical protein
MPPDGGQGLEVSNTACTHRVVWYAERIGCS